MLLQEAARRFIGPELLHSPAAAIIYRGFDHRAMRTVCEELQKPKLRAKYQQVLGRTELSEPMRRFAAAFPELQDDRHRADYDPAAKYGVSDTVEVIDDAAAAITAFQTADKAEQAEVLALLLAGARS